MSFRYIGSKARLTQQIAASIGPHRQGFFVDVFCGTGAIAEAAAHLGWPVRLNDHLVSATEIAAARLTSKAQVAFEMFGGYEAAIERLNSAEDFDGFTWREYSPASMNRIGFERRYFTPENARRIDGIRRQIHLWRTDGHLTRHEEALLVSDLLGAANRVANIAGTYGCFLSQWTSQALEPLTLQARRLKQHSTKVEISNVDATAVSCDKADLVYLDPPYTKRQYASYYHVLETIVKGDEPAVEGVSGLRPWKHLSSDYCFKVRALKTLLTLIKSLPAQKILVSYSSEGHIRLDDLVDGLSEISVVRVDELATVGRYRPNRKASAAGSSVKEFLLTIEKQNAQTELECSPA